MKFAPTKQKIFSKHIYGFDIETYGQKNKFLMCSITGENYSKTFYGKENAINEFKNLHFSNCWIAATNLQFDFFGLFEGYEDIKGFNLLWRGSDLLYAKTFIQDKKFNRKVKHNHKGETSFIDTMNYAKMSVENLGKLLKLKKLERPDFIGKYPENQEQWDIMKEYNIRDADISRKALEFFTDSFSQLGATPKLTIGATAMSLYKNHFLENEYWRHTKEQLIDEFNAYYGGNNHAYRRGAVTNMYLYDINSLYPFSMINDFPDPNTLRITQKLDDFYYIENYKGISHVKIWCPDKLAYPLLPVRIGGKLLFPHGTFEGWYTHDELIEAFQHGYQLINLYKTYYFLENCRPFDKFVRHMWDMRKKLKLEGNSMEAVVKLIMNSLYGKFGQKFIDKDNWDIFDHTIEELAKFSSIERFGNYIRTVKHISEPAAHCIPIWSLYVTAYGRLHLYKLIKQSRPYYVDTDSLLLPKRKYKDSSELGELKLELFAEKGLIIKPKMYTLNERVKAKGLGRKLNVLDIQKILDTHKCSYNKFVKFKESIRRKLSINEILPIEKTIDTEDTKRIWQKPFDPYDLQSSWPHVVGNIQEHSKYKKQFENFQPIYPYIESL